MSRIGRAPISIPQGVDIKVNGDEFIVKGPLGTLTQKFDSANIGFNFEDGVVHVVRNNETSPVKAKHGLYRALLANMVKGVTEGYTKTLVVAGVGWKVVQNGNNITLSIGYSHTINYAAVDGIKLACPTPTEIKVSGISKELVGQEAAKIRKLREPEPYHGYGIHYSDEVIERKEGKTAGK